MAHGRLSLLRPDHCSATVNVACGMLAEWLDCSVVEAFRVLQRQAGEDPGRLETIAAGVLARHSLLIGHGAACSGADYRVSLLDKATTPRKSTSWTGLTDTSEI